MGACRRDAKDGCANKKRRGVRLSWQRWKPGWQRPAVEIAETRWAWQDAGGLQTGCSRGAGADAQWVSVPCVKDFGVSSGCTGSAQGANWDGDDAPEVPKLPETGARLAACGQGFGQTKGAWCHLLVGSWIAPPSRHPGADSPGLAKTPR